MKTDEEGMKGIPTGCLCGALAAGVLVLGALYGRSAPVGPRFGCISHLAAQLHKRFQEELGGKCCALLRPFYQKMDREHSCSHVYQKGAELAVEVALSDPSLVPTCRLPGALRSLGRRKGPGTQRDAGTPGSRGEGAREGMTLHRDSLEMPEKVGPSHKRG